VVKVRGNAVPGPLKIAGERFQAPHSRINGTSRLRRAPAAYSTAPIFSAFLGPKFMF